MIRPPLGMVHRDPDHRPLVLLRCVGCRMWQDGLWPHHYPDCEALRIMTEAAALAEKQWEERMRGWNA